LVALKSLERMRGDVATTKREREDAAQGTEDPFDRPGRKPIGLQLAHECDDIVGSDQPQPTSGEPGQQMTMQLRAIEVECAIATLSRCDPRLELGQPARCDLREGEPRGDRQLAHASEALE